MSFDVRNSDVLKNKKWPQYVTVLITLIIIFCAGIHLGWPTPSLPKLLSEDFVFKVTSEEASYVVTLSTAGEIIGYIVSSLVMDLIGRKLNLLLSAPLHLISMLLVHFSSSVGFLYAARIIGGLAVGGSIITTKVYICEISEPKIRGALISLYPVFWSGGILFINLVGSFNSIRTTSLITVIFPVAFLLFFVFLPESPYFFLMKKKHPDAVNSLRKLRGSEDVNEEMLELQSDVNRDMSEKGRLQDLVLIKSNRAALIIMGLLGFVQLFSGATALITYAQIFFAEATDVIPKEWAALLLQLIEISFMFISASLIDILGRRLLLLISTAGCLITLILLSVFFFLKDFTSLQVEEYSWLALVGMLVFIIFFVAGLGIVVNCLGGELFSASVKAKALCVLCIFYSACVFASTKFYQVLADGYSTGLPLGVFGIVQGLGFGFCWKFVPETKGKSLGEIQKELKEK